MQKIKEILAASGIQASDHEIEALIAELGSTPEQVDETQAQAIADELIRRKGSSALSTTKAKNGKVAKSNGRKKVQDIGLNDAIAHVAGEANKELAELSNAIKQGAEQYAEFQSEQLLNEVRNVPTKVVENFVQRAMGEQADTKSFRSVGTAIAQGLFGNFSTNEAV